MTPEPLHKKPEVPRGIEKREVPHNLEHGLEVCWRAVLDRVKKQSEARQSQS